MRRCVAILASFWLAGPALADWVPMTGADIKTTLSDARLEYNPAWQEFYASGRTLYNAGADSWGYWEARGDQYCSSWPPASGWACYTMERDTDTGNLRFIGESGDVTVGVLAK